MKIAQVHNYYRNPGGEDVVVEAERKLLRDHGHSVESFTASNSDIADGRQLAVALGSVWNQGTSRRFRAFLERTRPDLVHCHNTFPLLSPSVYYAARAERVPVVQTLHNFRLACPNALLFRDGKPCEECLARVIKWPAVRHACYRTSRLASGSVAVMLAAHWAVRTWSRTVNVYISLSRFARRKAIAGGLPAERIVVKPNFVPTDLTAGAGDGGFCLFVGRLSAEKGVSTLLEAWNLLENPPLLLIVGDGPLADELGFDAAEQPRIRWLGGKAPHEVHDLMGAARLVIVPSESYETFGLVVIEAFAKGTPVLGANSGALGDLIEPGQTGQLFTPGDAQDLAANVQGLLAAPRQLDAMRASARAEYEKKYTAAGNYPLLLQIYERARLTTV